MLWSEIAGMATAAGGAVFGSVKGAIEAARRRKILKQKERENRRWYNRRYNEVGTERANAKKALTAMRDAQEQRVANARGRAAVMGGSSAAVAQEKQAANQALGNTVANINAQAEQQKDGIEKQYLAQQDAIQNARMNMSAQTNANIANATGQAIAAGAGMMGSVGSSEAKATKPATTTPGVSEEIADPNYDPFNYGKEYGSWT